MLRQGKNLVAEISGALGKDKRTRDAAIEVLEHNGTVTLMGEVSSTEAKSAAEGIVRSHPGVVAVINELKVVRR